MEYHDSSRDSSQELRFTLREIIRQKISQQRKEQRDVVLFGRRHIEDSNFDASKLNVTDIQALALRIKKKQGGREAIYKDLNTLQAALSFSGKVNGEAFAKVDGAIAALIRDVSGRDSSLQLRATYCCANLSLAGAEIGLKVAKAVCPYLMNHLQGMNQILMEASLWAAGSLAGSGMPAFKVIEVQGFFPHLINIMTQYHPSSAKHPSQTKVKTKLQENRIIEAALYAAAHCVSVCLHNNQFPSEIELLASSSIPLLNRVDTYALPRLTYLFFVLTCSDVCDDIFLKPDFLMKMIILLDETLLILADPQNDLNAQGFAIQIVTFIIRILGNLCSTDTGRTYLENMSDTACPIIKHLMEKAMNLPSHIVKETLWFVMQLLKPYSEFSNEHVNVNDCPWSPLAHLFNICLGKQTKKNVLPNSSFFAGILVQ